MKPIQFDYNNKKKKIKVNKYVHAIKYPKLLEV